MKIKLLFNIFLILFINKYVQSIQEIKSNNTELKINDQILFKNETEDKLNKNNTEQMNNKLTLHNKPEFNISTNNINESLSNRTFFNFLQSDFCLICELFVEQLKEEMNNNTEKLKEVYFFIKFFMF